MTRIANIRLTPLLGFFFSFILFILPVSPNTTTCLVCITLKGVFSCTIVFFPVKKKILSFLFKNFGRIIFYLEKKIFLFKSLDQELEISYIICFLWQ